MHGIGFNQEGYGKKNYRILEIGLAKDRVVIIIDCAILHMKYDE